MAQLGCGKRAYLVTGNQGKKRRGFENCMRDMMVEEHALKQRRIAVRPGARCSGRGLATLSPIPGSFDEITNQKLAHAPCAQQRPCCGP